MKPFTKKIVLENGREFYGYGFGADREAINEIVFNTSMVGYQEIMSDPSYTDQMVVMTYPLIGNYGMADEDYETKNPTIGGMIVREYNDSPSNFRYTKTLNEVFEEYGIPAIWGVDTRTLTRIIRNEGSQKVIVTDAATPREEAMRKLAEYRLPHDMVSRVSCKKRWMSRVPNHKYDVVAVDCGIKHNIIRQLNRVGCNVTIVPYDSTVEEIMAFHPDGIVLSNGPGNPEDVTPVIGLVRQLRGKLPIFGICMGHQLISLAYGAKTVKMKFGHRGGNHQQGQAQHLPANAQQIRYLHVVSNALGFVFEGNQQHGLAGKVVGHGPIQLGEGPGKLVLQHLPCAGCLSHRRKLLADGIQVVGGGGHRLGTAGGPGSILGRSHVQHHIGCGESGFQLRRSSVGILRKITQTVGVRLAVPLGGQSGLVLGHQQFQCLQGSIADGIRYRAFDTALLDANIHDLACVVRQGQVAVGLHDQQGRHGQACRPMACQLFKYFRHRRVLPVFVC